MDKDEFQRKLEKKRAKAGKEVETLEMITSGDIVEEVQEPERVRIITTADVLGIQRRRDRKDRPQIITTRDVPRIQAKRKQDSEESTLKKQIATKNVKPGGKDEQE